ncbi:aminotransferase class I/II-fold pyridoxal phosphate-dependent enzyme [Nonomuraea salmonea]|uniref:aminotransferase class I/II-fold pyridoxal phosphate-dependent enzyme n=1 Tax=Nonomuraea salmonea TaxID=46181 RepID=UPI0031E549A0
MGSSGRRWNQASSPPGSPTWTCPRPPAVTEALARRTAGDLGYPAWLLDPSAGPLAEAFAERMSARHGWDPDPTHVRPFNDLNQALQVLLQIGTRPGDGVALHVPAYPPFLTTLEVMDRRLHPISLEPDGDTWRFEVPDLSGCRVLLLVNPHNPTGRVFTRAELTALAECAERHDLLVIADEIHADLVYAPHHHIPFATILPDRTVTLTSATKAFNLGGIRCSVAHLGHAGVRAALEAQPPFVYGSPQRLRRRGHGRGLAARGRLAGRDPGPARPQPPHDRRPAAGDVRLPAAGGDVPGLAGGGAAGHGGGDRARGQGQAERRRRLRPRRRALRTAQLRHHRGHPGRDPHPADRPLRPAGPPRAAQPIITADHHHRPPGPTIRGDYQAGSGGSSGGVAGGCSSSAASASSIALSSCGSRPATRSCGVITTSTSGSTP